MRWLFEVEAAWKELDRLQVRSERRRKHRRSSCIPLCDFVWRQPGAIHRCGAQRYPSEWSVWVCVCVCLSMSDSVFQYEWQCGFEQFRVCEWTGDVVLGSVSNRSTLLFLVRPLASCFHSHLCFALFLRSWGGTPRQLKRCGSWTSECVWPN